MHECGVVGVNFSPRMVLSSTPFPHLCPHLILRTVRASVLPFTPYSHLCPHQFGRAGRDGTEASCWLVLDNSDYERLRSLCCSNAAELVCVQAFLRKVWRMCVCVSVLQLLVMSWQSEVYVHSEQGSYLTTYVPGAFPPGLDESCSPHQLFGVHPIAATYNVHFRCFRRPSMTSLEALIRCLASSYGCHTNILFRCFRRPSGMSLVALVRCLAFSPSLKPVPIWTLQRRRWKPY